MKKHIHLFKTISKVKNLKPGMVITSYLGLGKIFENLDQQVCQDIKIEFRGAKATILRRNTQLDIKVQNLSEGDTVFKIFDLPDHDEGPTHVNTELIEFLKINGFNQFRVLCPEKGENEINKTINQNSSQSRAHHKFKSRLTEGNNPNKGKFKEDNNLLKQLKKSEEARQNLVKTAKPVKIKWEKPLTRSKDEFLVGLKKSEELRKKYKNVKSTKSRKQNTDSRTYKVDRANELLDGLRKSVKIREEATEAVEELMDKARKKKITLASIKYYIDFVVKNSTSTAMAALANIKASDQTYGHCTDVASIFSSVYLHIKKQSKKASVFRNKNHAMLAAFLHDFGKSQIPKDIIDSSKVFSRDSEEMRLIQTHPKLGAKLLVDKMNVPDTFINMTLYHHVKNSRNHINSYPKIKPSIQLIYETQLLAIVDIYQALIGKRLYKTPWSPAAAMQYLRSMAGPEFDHTVFNQFRRAMGDFPVGTLVKLSDSNIGFVVSVPEKDLSKPGVVLVQDFKGNRLKKNPFIDLKKEKGLSITQDLNTEVVLGKAGIDLFQQIQVS